MQNQQVQLTNKFVLSVIEIVTSNAKFQILSKWDYEEALQSIGKAMKDGMLLKLESNHPQSVTAPKQYYLVDGTDIKSVMVQQVSHILTADSLQ